MQYLWSVALWWSRSFRHRFSCRGRRYPVCRGCSEDRSAGSQWSENRLASPPRCRSSDPAKISEGRKRLRSYLKPLPWPNESPISSGSRRSGHEVLGASGFKDIKKTVGEENRLVIFDDLEERVYDILHDPYRQERNEQLNRERVDREGLMAGYGWRYSQLKEMIQPTLLPHRFYDVNLPPPCYRIFDQDHVWPASLISSVGRMAGGDRETLLLKNAESCGKLGDGFDAIKIRFNQDPDDIPEKRADEVSTALQLTPGLRLKTPFIGAGMSIGSIGPGTWRARVLATRALKTQLDTGEGGYPTFYILDSKWNPLELTDRQVILLGRVMEEKKAHYCGGSDPAFSKERIPVPRI